MRLVTDALLRRHSNITEQDPKHVGVEVDVETMLDLKTFVEREYNIPVASQHYWLYITRINKTVRPSQYVRAYDFRINSSTILFLHERRTPVAQDDILVMIKRFDTASMSLEHVGTTLLAAGMGAAGVGGGKPSPLLLLKEAYLEMEKTHSVVPDDLDCYEIVNNLRVLKITDEEGGGSSGVEAIMEHDIECGDCICFQPSCQTPTFGDMHILFSGNYIQMASKLFTSQDAFITSHTRSLFNNKELSDVSIMVQDTRFYVNKCILASIPYFKTMLFGRMKESTQTEVVLQDVNAKGFEALLKYVYKVQDWCPKDDMQSLLDLLLLIDMYGMDEKFKAEVEAIISGKLTPDNVLGVVFATASISSPRLKERCTSLIEHNIYSVAKSADFASFCAEHKTCMLEIMGRIQYKLSGRKPTLIIGRRMTST